MVYLTDGSFDGLLTAVFESFQRKEAEARIGTRASIQMQLGEDAYDINTDAEKAERVYRGINNKISEDVLTEIYRAYLSEHEDIGTAINRYVHKGMKIGARIIGNLQDPDVFFVHDYNRKVMGEAHLLLGLTRFMKLENGVYHAVIEPRYNVLGLVAPHFTDRLSDQPWIIQDIGRGLSALYDTQELVFSNEPIPIHDHTIDAEADFQSLWQRYFKSIAIESRINPKLQRGFMPQRYWKHLIEKVGSRGAD